MVNDISAHNHRHSMTPPPVRRARTASLVAAAGSSLARTTGHSQADSAMIGDQHLSPSRAPGTEGSSGVATAQSESPTLMRLYKGFVLENDDTSDEPRNTLCTLDELLRSQSPTNSSHASEAPVAKNTGLEELPAGRRCQRVSFAGGGVEALRASRRSISGRLSMVMPSTPSEGIPAGARRRTRASVSGRCGPSSARLSVSGASPPPAVPDEKRKGGPSVEHVLTDVMRAYTNLELDVVNSATLVTLASALRTNESVTTVNLSFSTHIDDEGVRTLADGLAHNSTVESLNRECTGACAAWCDQARRSRVCLLTVCTYPARPPASSKLSRPFAFSRTQSLGALAFRTLQRPTCCKCCTLDT